METDRRRLITVLIIIAIAVPIVIEGMTLLGLVGQYFGDDTGTPTATATPAPASGTVGVGDDLLAETDRTEEVTTATVQTGEQWTFTLTVSVENTAGAPYELRLGAVTTNDGRRIDGEATTGQISPNGTATVTAQWTLPSGSLPDTVTVVAVENSETTLVDREVNLAHIPATG
jgi:hypothetical protein